jgi:hypothetical protein
MRKEVERLKRIVMVLVVAALVAVAMMGSAGPVFGGHGGSHGVGKSSPLLFGCGGVNNAVSKGAEPNYKFSDILVGGCAPDILPPGQEPTPPTP